MAIHASAIKRVRQTKKRRVRNRHYKSTLKTYVKDLVKNLEVGGTAQLKENIQKELSQVIGWVAKSASKGAIPNKRASRIVARLSLKVQKLLQPASAA